MQNRERAVVDDGGGRGSISADARACDCSVRLHLAVAFEKQDNALRQPDHCSREQR